MNKVFKLLSVLLSVLLTWIFSSFSAQTDIIPPYFQQTVNHNIHVSLDDVEHELNAEIWTNYTNNSEKSLEYLWYHVWPNAYSSGKSALAKQQLGGGNTFLFYAMAKDLGGIDGLDFKVDGKSTSWEFHTEHPDIVKILLRTPLMPGDTIEIHTPFKVRIPSGKISRLGHVGQSYQITQWYPKPAVYDRDGWHEMPYLDQGEFYSEFGSFDVTITLPDNYTIGATGDMPLSKENDNESELARLNKIDQDTRKYFEQKDNLGLTKNTLGEFPVSSRLIKTLHYHQKNIHDFAWFADKRFKVLKDSIELPHSGRTVTTWVMFTPNEEDLWREAPKYIGNATYYYSLWNGDYPYNQVTAIDGTISAGGGMEYPNVTVIGESGSAFSLDVVIAHEVGHNWFYGILGSNERTNAWMDEGLNSLNETRYLLESYEGKDLGLISSRLSEKWMERLDLLDFEYRWIDELMSLLPSRFGTSQPLQCHSAAFSSSNYGAIAYKKTAAIFAFLRQYLGTEKFDKAMQQYFEDWKFKHPSPSDLQASLESSCGEDLNWFFSGWVKTIGKNDWKIANVKGGNSVTIVNSGELKSPVEVVSYNGDEEVSRTWVKPSEPGTKVTIDLPGYDVTSVRLDPGRYDLDYDRKNDNIRTSGLLKKIEPLQIRMGTRLEDGNKTQVFILPAIAWNAQNGLMLGATFHNTSLGFRDFEWMATPLLSKTTYEGDYQLAGLARLSYHSGPWAINLRASRFSALEYIVYPGQSIYELDPVPMNRLSFSIHRKFNKIVNSNWASTAQLETVLLNGYRDADVFHAPVNNISHSIKFDAVKKRGGMIGLKNYMGLEIKNYNLPVADVILIYPPTFRNTSASTAMVYYTAQRKNRQGRRATVNFLGLSKLNFDAHPLQWSPLVIPTAGFGAQYDPMHDELLMNRNISSGILSRAAALEHGALPLIHFAQKWMVSSRIGYEVTSNVEAFAGALVYDESYGDLVAGLAYTLGPLKIHMPLYSISMMEDINATEGNKYEPWNYWMFSLDLRKLEPWGMIRKTN